MFSLAVITSGLLASLARHLALQEHLDQCIKDVKLKRPAFDTPETFLKFSDEMTLEMFTRIFED
jgi:hypothetical protein